MLQELFGIPTLVRRCPRHKAFSRGHIDQRRLTCSVIQMGARKHPSGDVGLIAIEGEHVPPQLVLLSNESPFEHWENLHHKIIVSSHFGIIESQSFWNNRKPG